MGSVNWKLALCLALAWGIVLVALIRGIASLGKVKNPLCSIMLINKLHHECQKESDQFLNPFLEKVNMLLIDSFYICHTMCMANKLRSMHTIAERMQFNTCT